MPWVWLEPVRLARVDLVVRVRMRFPLVAMPSVRLVRLESAVMECLVLAQRVRLAAM
jgi:hypothetical protein